MQLLYMVSNMYDLIPFSHQIIEEIEERLSEEEISQLLEIVNTILPGETSEEADNQESFIEQSEAHSAEGVEPDPEMHSDPV